MCVFGGMRKRLFINDPDSKDYRVALCRCALNPDYSLNLRRNSLDRHLTGISLFIWRGRDLSPDGAALTEKNFRETMALAGAESGGPVCNHRMSKIAQEAQCRPRSAPDDTGGNYQ